jgi:predicted ATPase/DNA-binding CsgD family transcriptional regulator
MGRIRPRLVGRDEDLSKLEQLVGRHAAVTVVGPGGVGKTRLVGALTDAMQGEHVVVVLEEITDPAEVDKAVAVALGLRPHEHGTVTDQMLAVAEHSWPMLVLDGCERVATACAALVDALVDRGIAMHVVATSRTALGSADEAVLRLAPLGTPAPAATPEAARSSPAVQLFLDAARRSGVELEDDDHLAVVAEMCRELDGLPLAITLVAARCGTLPLAALADEVSDDALVVARPGRTRDGRRTLAGSVAWGYQQLDAREQRALRRLASFAGDIPFEGAVDVIGGGRAAAMDDLTALVECSLLEPPAGDLYRMLHAVRRFALDESDRLGERAGNQDAHAEWLRRQLDRMDTLEPDDALLERIDSLHPDTVAAMRWWLEARDPRLIDLVEHVATPWEVVGRHHDAGVFGMAALAMAEEGSRRWCRLIGLLSTERVMAGDVAFTRDVVPRAAAIARRSNDDESELLCRGGLAIAPPQTADELIATAEGLARLGWRFRALLLEAWAAAAAAAAGRLADADRRVAAVAARAGRRAVVELLATAALGRVDSLLLRGDLRAGVELARTWAGTGRVSPTVRALHAARWAQGATVLGDAGELEATADLLRRLSEMSPEVEVFARSTQLREDFVGGRIGSPAAFLEVARRGTAAATPLALHFLLHAAVAAQEGVAASAVPRQHEGTSPSPVEQVIVASVAAGAAHARGEQQQAARLWTDALVMADDEGFRHLLAEACEGLGCVLAANGQVERAGQALATAGAIRAETGARFRFPHQQAALDAAMAVVGALPRPEPDAAIDALRRLGGRTRPTGGWDSLTTTEVTVAHHVAGGLSNPEIAVQMGVARSTVKTHLLHIFTKLSVTSRAELAATVIRQRLPTEGVGGS